MNKKKNIFAIVGSASKNSSNLKLVQKIAALINEEFDVTIYENLSHLPHFTPELSIENTPQQVLNFRQSIRQANGIIICTPEYVFSIPAGLKNAIEWCVSTTVFSKKPIGLITASASGQKAHEELQLIMRTVEASFSSKTTLLINGIKAKIDAQGNITDAAINYKLSIFIAALIKLVNEATVAL